MSSFWSKGRNRGVIYGIGAIILFGSYVIGAPDSGRTARKKAPKRTKLEASLPASSEDVAVDSPFADTDDSFETNSIPSTITPETVAIAPSTTPAGTIQPNYAYPSGSSTMFDPVNDRELTEVQERAVEREMERPSTQYPYEVSDEETNLAEQAQRRELTPEEKVRQVDFALSFGRYRQPPSKVSAKTGTNSNTSGSGSFSTSQRNILPTSKYYSRAIASTKVSEIDSSDKGESKEGYQQGSVMEEERVQYLNPNFFNIPSEWNYTHEFLEVYAFTPGINAGVIPAAWGKIGGSLYTKIKPDQNKLLHDKYRIPPDWDNRYKFSDDQNEEIRLSTVASNKHLLSLGTNGAVTFVVTQGKLMNGNGADFVIWSHPFCFIKTEKTVEEMNAGSRKEYQKYIPKNNRAIAGLENGVQCQTELAKVYVSSEGPNTDDWTAIEPCQKGGDPMSSRCAGYGINLWNQTPTPFSPMSGGDRYDLSDVGLAEINAIKIVDLGNPGEFQKGGFDLDAIAMIHFLKETIGSKSK